MAIRKCKGCGNQISRSVKQCTHCGAPVKRKPGCLGIIGYIFIATIVFGCILSALNNKQTSPPSKSETFYAPTRPTTAKPEPEQPKSVLKPQAESVVPDWNARQAELKALFLPEFQAPKIGTHISLKLKGGTTQEGIIKSLTDSEIQIERGPATIGLSKSHLDTESRVRCFASDYATYKAYQQTKQERDTFESRERANNAELNAQPKTEHNTLLAAEPKKSNAEMIATLDGSRNSARYEYLLTQLSQSFRVPEKTIADQTAGVVQTLKQDGIKETFLNIMEGVNSISHDIKGPYLDTLAVYASLRNMGKSHSETILSIEAMWNDLTKINK